MSVLIEQLRSEIRDWELEILIAGHHRNTAIRRRQLLSSIEHDERGMQLVIIRAFREKIVELERKIQHNKERIGEISYQSQKGVERY